MNTSSRISKVLCIVASSLLIFVALFHVSGLSYLSEIIQKSNLSDFIKEIFPVLFILPTIQLIGLAAFGLLSIRLKAQARPLLLLLALLVFIDALLAFYLNAWIPAFILLLPALIYVFAAFYAPVERSNSTLGIN